MFYIETVEYADVRIVLINFYKPDIAKKRIFSIIYIYIYIIYIYIYFIYLYIYFYIF